MGVDIWPSGQDTAADVHSHLQSAWSTPRFQPLWMHVHDDRWVPATHVGEQDWVPSMALPVAEIEEISEQMGGLLLLWKETNFQKLKA